ncbi:LysR family transcriptional regulator [Haloechinothrix halophila]|uniref:LysR family transcriptional regulator n=1 Tax=Haloechinothrix halophila TaxID=1069073 RepID=UPI0003F9CB40|nr:LysR family transcriptional regulator [Haloechinothrix halophila]
MDLTIQQLRYFVAVAEHLHFTRAAERLHIAPPSLSQQIAAIERRVGSPLFRRTSRRVELTASGAELLPLARRAIASVEEILTWADRRRGADQQVRLGLVVGNRISSAILSAAAKQLPGVRWEVRRIGFGESVQALKEGRADVVLTPSVRPPSAGGLCAVPLWSEGRVLVVSSTHPLADRGWVDLDETNGERFIASDGAPSDLAEWFVVPRPGGFTPRVESLVTNFEEVLDVCSAGLGVNIAGSTAAVSYARPDITYVPIRGITDATVYLLRESPAPEAVIAFERIAADVARSEAGRYGGRKPVCDRREQTATAAA